MPGTNHNTKNFDFNTWNERTHVQFRLTPQQKLILQKRAPEGMSVNQAAKWLLLDLIDPPVANEMRNLAQEGKQRLT